MVASIKLALQRIGLGVEWAIAIGVLALMMAFAIWVAGGGLVQAAGYALVFWIATLAILASALALGPRDSL